MSERLDEWREQWNNGDVKFVPELFEKAEQLEAENERLREVLTNINTLTLNPEEYQPSANLIGRMTPCYKGYAKRPCGHCGKDLNATTHSRTYEMQQRNKFGKYNGYYKWDLAVDYFKMSNDDFFKLYGFNFVPKGELWEQAKAFRWGVKPAAPPLFAEPMFKTGSITNETSKNVAIMAAFLNSKSFRSGC